MNASESLAAARAEVLSAGGGTTAADPPVSAAAAPATEGDSTPAETSADPKANGAPSSTEAGSSTPPVANAGSDSTVATTDAAAPADPVETRLLSLAKAEQRVREQGKKQRAELEAAAEAQKSKLEAGERLTRARDAWKQDPLAALEALGFSAEDIYSPSAIDSYLKKATPPSPEQQIEQIVERRLAAERKAREESETQQYTARQTEVRAGYVKGAQALLRSDVAKYPSLVQALATGEVEVGEIADAGQTYFDKTGKTPEYATILGFIEAELSKSKPSAPKIEAKALPRPPVATNNAPPAPERRLTAEESLALAKREAGLSV